MSRDVNQVNLLGRLGADVDLRYTGTGKAAANLSVATSRRVKQGDEYVDKTEWTSVVCWEQSAEFAAGALRKGSRVFVAGRLETRSWEDKETGATRYKTEVIANEVIALDPRPVDQMAAQAEDPVGFNEPPRDRGANVPQRRPVVEVDDDQLPF